MDRKSEDKEKRVNKETGANLYNLMHSIIDDSYKEARANIDKMLKSRGVWGKDKSAIAMIGALLDITTMNTKQDVSILYLIEDIQRKLENLQKVVEEIAKNADTDISRLKSELKEQKLPKTARQYIEEFRQEYEQWKQLSGKFFEKE